MPTRMLPVRLTADELAANNARLVAALETRAQIDAERKQLADDFKGRLEQADAEASDLQRVGASGCENRPVDVFERRNVRDRTIETVRSDTGESVSVRPMTPAEYEDAVQTKLPLDADEPRDANDPLPLVLAVGCWVEDKSGREGVVYEITGGFARIEWKDDQKKSKVSAKNIYPGGKFRVVQSAPTKKTALAKAG